MPIHDPDEGANRPWVVPRRSPNQSTRAPTALEAAMDCVRGELREGLTHGFFDFEMSCEIVRGGKRQFTLRAGKSHRFVIPKEELE